MLSSKGIPARLGELTRGPRAVLVPNAADAYTAPARARKVRYDTAALSAAGFDVRVLDLSRHTAARSPLPGWVTQADLLWAGAGNTFALTRLLHASGLADRAAEMVESGVVWGGDSAGAVACAPVLHGVQTVDRRTRGATFEGLGLVDFLPWPHWRPDRDPTASRHHPMPGAQTRMYRLQDGEHLVVTGDQVLLVDPCTDPQATLF